MERNPWIPWRKTVLKDGSIHYGPHPRQRQFLLFSDVYEVLYGGAAGGGKSDALLMAAAQYVEEPSYAAILFRESFPQLMKPDALIPRSKEWWLGKGPKWNQQNHQWTFPSGATITFAYMERDDDVHEVQGPAVQFIGFDEATHQSEFRYRYMFSRLRPNASTPPWLPMRMRGATNPGGRGHEFFKARFIDERTRAPGVVFVPARLSDNPTLPEAQYTQALMHLDPISRDQLLLGDWNAYAGGRYKSKWFEDRRYIRHLDSFKLGSRRFNERDIRDRFLTVDPAATEEGLPDSPDDPDYTVISAWGTSPHGDLLWLGVLRLRVEIPDIPDAVATMYERHQARAVHVEGFGIGKGPIQILKRHKLSNGAHMNVIGYAPNKNKLAMAAEALNLAEAGRLWLPLKDPAFEEAEAELLRFTGDSKKDGHDDVVDTVSRAAIVVGRKADIKGAHHDQQYRQQTYMEL